MYLPGSSLEAHLKNGKLFVLFDGALSLRG